jgi:zinc protease
MRRKAALLFLSFVLLWTGLNAAFGPANVKTHTLENGLKVLLVEDHTIPNVALYTFFRVGSRNERQGITGCSHFIEHMMFNGTAKFGPGEFDRRMEFMGGSNNAYTGDDMTAYTDWFPKTALESMIEMEADRIQGMALVPEVFESERGVIASERRNGVENNNDSILYENVRATAIMAHPYHWMTIGWMSDILSWQRDDIMAYYRTFYAPSNAVLILAGDFESPVALDLIKKHYGPIPAGPTPPPVRTVEPPQMGKKRVVVRKEAQTPSFMMAFHAPGCRDKDFYPLSLLEKPLLRGESSRLHRRLVREEELALEVGGGIGENIDPCLFMIFVKPRPGADLDRIEAVIGEELEKIRREGITDKEIQKALNIIRSDFYSGLQTIAGKADALGNAELLYGNFAEMFTKIDAYAGVSGERIRAAAGTYLKDDNMTVGRLIPEGDEK